MRTIVPSCAPLTQKTATECKPVLSRQARPFRLSQELQLESNSNTQTRSHYLMQSRTKEISRRSEARGSLQQAGDISTSCLMSVKVFVTPDHHHRASIESIDSMDSVESSFDSNGALRDGSVSFSRGTPPHPVCFLKRSSRSMRSPWLEPGWASRSAAVDYLYEGE